MEDIEVGSEWFHRESLTPVVITHFDAEDDDAIFRSPPDLSGSTTAGVFLRDYARNEPVTVELLERMGWIADGPNLMMSSPAPYFPRDGKNVRLVACFHDDGALSSVEVGITHRSDENEAEVNAATLRDLLNVLRVFGLNDFVIPAATDTDPTAKA